MHENQYMYLDNRPQYWAITLVICVHLKRKQYNINYLFVCLQKPIKKVLGRRQAIVKRNNKRKVVQVEDCFYYISVLETIQLEISWPQVLQMIFSGREQRNNQNIFADFTDANFFRHHELFSNDPFALRILLYYDDVSFSNPLTNKPHKVSFFYFQLANLGPEYRSKLKSIHLFAVCKTVHIQKYDIDKNFEPLVVDLKLLASDSGYIFDIPGGPVKLRGAVLAFIADTPASQKAGGFKESVGGAKRKCRHCMATFETMQNHFLEEDFQLRDLPTHLKQLQKLENAPCSYLRTFFSKNYGVNRRSELLNAPFFDVCQQLPQDIMHVFLEGVVPYEIKLLLQLYIEHGHFTMEELNNQIKHFPYGYTDIKDKPLPIRMQDLDLDSSSNLGQTATKMWLLARILPLLLIDLVDTNSSHWTLLTSLLEVMSIVFAGKISLESVAYLRNAVAEHLQLFKRLFEDVNIIPKQHYLVHLPSLIFKFGPLIRSWCMRFEGKHSYFKKVAAVLKNFKNLPFSLATRHQSMECAAHIQLDEFDVTPLFKEDLVLGRSRLLIGEDEQNVRNAIFNFFQINLPNTEGIL